MTNAELFDSLRIESIPLVKIYRAEKKDYPMNNRGRSHHGLLLPLEGTEVYRFSDCTLSAPPDSVLYIPKGEVYRIDLDSEKGTVICIDIELILPISLRPTRFSLTDRGVAASIRDMFFEANEVFAKGAEGRRTALLASVYRIISALIGQESRSLSSAAEKKLAPALEHLHAHYTDPELSVEMLASMCGIGRRYFEKLFFAEKGTTPREYMLGLKMELARELLLGEKLSVADVAYELGYADVYHFCKIFKQKVGTTPGAYKRESCEKAKARAVGK